MVGMGGGLGMGLRRNTLLHAILGLPPECTVFIPSEMWCVWFANRLFALVGTLVCGDRGEGKRGMRGKTIWVSNGLRSNRRQ